MRLVVCTTQSKHPSVLALMSGVNIYRLMVELSPTVFSRHWKSVCAEGERMCRGVDAEYTQAEVVRRGVQS